MGKKEKITLYMDGEIVEKAKELGFNLSKLCENCLKQAIAKMEGSHCPEDEGKLSVNAFSERVERARRELSQR
jgi:post-segregation antitoxin (ccd killing protein)